MAIPSPAANDFDFAVAPAPVWHLLWLWVPMLVCAALIVVTTLQSDQRTPYELGFTVPFLVVLTAVLSAMFFRRRIRLQDRQLEVVSTFYRKRVPVQD
ncbi:MAG: hypothetical protein ACK4FW_05970, partial [Stenotrophomonas sp.]